MTYRKQGAEQEQHKTGEFTFKVFLPKSVAVTTATNIPTKTKAIMTRTLGRAIHSDYCWESHSCPICQQKAAKSTASSNVTSQESVLMDGLINVGHGIVPRSMPKRKRRANRVTRSSGSRKDCTLPLKDVLKRRA